MAQVYAPVRTPSRPTTALLGAVAVVVGAAVATLWALLQLSPVAVVVFMAATAVFWSAMFATAADQE